MFESGFIFKVLASLLVISRIISAFTNNITDCDECVFLVKTIHKSRTYNFWEPTHFILYGRGFQTWEYTREFSLRVKNIFKKVD